MIIWEDPPPRPVNRSGGCPPERSRRDWYAIAAHLRDRPGQWARSTTAPSKTTASSIAGYINRGLNAVLGAGFEATSRTVDGEFRVYVRYVGGAGSEATPNDLPVGPGSTSPEPGPTPCKLADWCVVTGPHDAYGCQVAAESTKDGTETGGGS